MSFQVLPTPVVTASEEVPFGILQQLLGSPLLMGSWSSRDSFHCPSSLWETFPSSLWETFGWWS